MKCHDAAVTDFICQYLQFPGTKSVVTRHHMMMFSAVSRVELIYQICVKFYGHSILIMIYRIRKKFAKISSSRYR